MERVNASAQSPRMYLMRKEGQSFLVFRGQRSGGGGGGGSKAAFRVPDKRELWPRVKKLGGIEGGSETVREGAARTGRKKGREGGS